jgi:hypothetical protein
MALDVLPGCAGLAVSADAAARDGSFDGVSEAELIGVLCAWDRMEAHAHARKLAAVAELSRRYPGELDQEFTADQVAYALGESRARADSLIGMAQALLARLPGTAAALEDGTVSRYKAEIIARATVLLEDDEARAAEAEVLDRAAGLTPGGLRAAMGRAVIKVAPEKAKERRETAAKDARVERWLQDTGNAALMGCELPPGEGGFSFTPADRDGPPGGHGTWRLRTPGRRPGPDHHRRPDDHRPVRPPVRGPGPRPGTEAKASVSGPARHLHQPRLPAARRPVRPRAQHPLRSGRPDVSL